MSSSGRTNIESLSRKSSPIVSLECKIASQITIKEGESFSRDPKNSVKAGRSISEDIDYSRILNAKNMALACILESYSS
jgi:hypothetical protein